MENFQRQGRNFLGGGIKFFCIGQGGNSKQSHNYNFENDIDSKVTSEIGFLNISLYSKYPVRYKTKLGILFLKLLCYYHLQIVVWLVNATTDELITEGRDANMKKGTFDGYGYLNIQFLSKNWNEARKAGLEYNDTWDGSACTWTTLQDDINSLARY